MPAKSSTSPTGVPPNSRSGDGVPASAGRKLRKASDILVRALEDEGVEYVFGVPGEENLDLLESLRTSKIRLIVTRHEQGAGFMAATYGRLTGNPGVCLATLGPGATNLVTPAAYAKLGAMPMVLITGQKPIKRSKQGRFQILNVVDMMQSLTKYTKQIVHANTIPGVVREAFRLAREERPGPCHLELPEDVASEVADDVHIMPVQRPERPEAGERALRHAAAMIAAARRPLLMIGAGANRKRVVEPLRRFVDKTGIPFTNTQMGKGVIGGRHEYYLGTAALSQGDFVHRAFEGADLIITVGHDVVEKPPFVMQPGGAKVIHLNFNSAHIDEVYFPQLEVIGDIASTMSRLTELVEPSPNHDFEHFKRIRELVLEHIAEGSDDARFPVVPQRLVADVRRAVPPDGIVALDNGMYKIWFARNYLTAQPNTILLDNALATMGAGLPSAMMAALMYRDKRVMAICGDGGFMMNSQEMETAVRLGLNLVVTVVRDGAYGMIRWKQSLDGYPDFGLDFGNPDFAAYAASYGARGHTVTAAEQLADTFQGCFEEGGVHLVDVPIDYSENERVLVRELRERTKEL